MKRLLIASIAAGFALIGAVAVQAAPRIGVASTITNNVTGTVSGATRALKTGDPVFQNEAVSSASRSRAQLLFRDETVFNIGPSSRVVLDRFIYNPSRSTGSIVMNVTKGAFRFISGSAKPTSYVIKTPVATIGVRGTILNGQLGSNGQSLDLEVTQGAAVICPEGKNKVQGPNPSKALKKDNNNCAIADELGTYTISQNADSGSPDGGNPGNPDPNSNDPIDNETDPFDDPNQGCQFSCDNF